MIGRVARSAIEQELERSRCRRRLGELLCGQRRQRIVRRGRGLLRLISTLPLTPSPELHCTVLSLARRAVAGGRWLAGGGRATLGQEVLDRRGIGHHSPRFRRVPAEVTRHLLGFCPPTQPADVLVFQHAWR
jgi:hypothetical protein